MAVHHKARTSYIPGRQYKRSRDTFKNPAPRMGCRINDLVRHKITKTRSRIVRINAGHRTIGLTPILGIFAGKVIDIPEITFAQDYEPLGAQDLCSSGENHQ
jgi:hypothetical protein